MGGQQPERAHHAVPGIGEGRGPEDFGDLVVELGEDVEEREQCLVVVEWERLRADRGLGRGTGTGMERTHGVG